MSRKNSDPLHSFKNEIIENLIPILRNLGYDQDIELEIPPTGLGDFAYPCFSLAPILKKNPAEIANQILSRLPKDANFSAESKGSYLNFFISKQKLVEAVLSTIFSMKMTYGSHAGNGIKMILEHTSANPPDKLHVGRARNPILGDTLARILRSAGFEVETQYYVDDMGKQTARKILAHRYRNLVKDISKFKTDYQWATSATTVSSDYYDISKEKELNQIMDGLESGNLGTLKEAERVCRLMMDDVIIPSLAKINVNIDRYVNESQFMLDNSVNEVMAQLKESGFSNIEDGAYYIDLNQFDIKSGKDKFFFIRADGKSLYATRDIAYHHWKFKKNEVCT